MAENPDEERKGEVERPQAERPEEAAPVEVGRNVLNGVLAVPVGGDSHEEAGVRVVPYGQHVAEEGREEADEDREELDRGDGGDVQAFTGARFVADVDAY